MDRCGCSSSTYGADARDATPSLAAQERDLVLARRRMARAEDWVSVARIDAELETIRDAMVLERRRGAARQEFSLPDEVALDRLPEARRPDGGSLRFTTSAERAKGHSTVFVPARDQALDLEAEVAAFEWGPSTVSSVERAVQADFAAWNRARAQAVYPGVAIERQRKFEAYLPAYRAIAIAVGRSGRPSAMNDPQIRAFEQKMKVNLLNQKRGDQWVLPSWFVTLTGRLLPLYVKEGAVSATARSTGYLRPGYGT